MRYAMPSTTGACFAGATSAAKSLPVMNVALASKKLLATFRTGNSNAVAPCSGGKFCTTGKGTGRENAPFAGRDPLQHFLATNRANGINNASLARNISADASSGARRPVLSGLMPRAALLYLVVAVVLNRSKEQVSRVHTGRIVATVANAVARWYFTSMQNPACSMRCDRIADRVHKSTIATSRIVARSWLSIKRAGPVPAASRFVADILSVKAYFGRFFSHVSCVPTKTSISMVSYGQ